MITQNSRLRTFLRRGCYHLQTTLLPSSWLRLADIIDPKAADIIEEDLPVRPSDSHRLSIKFTMSSLAIRNTRFDAVKYLRTKLTNTLVGFSNRKGIRLRLLHNAIIRACREIEPDRYTPRPYSVLVEVTVYISDPQEAGHTSDVSSNTSTL